MPRDYSDAEIALILEREEERANRQKRELEDSDADLARTLAAQEETCGWDRLEARHAAEDADAEFARLLAAKDRSHAMSVPFDKALGTELQAEHGRAGKLLSRAVQLEEFLEAPLGSRDLPQNGDLAPETLRRIVQLTTAKFATAPSGVLPTCGSPKAAALPALGAVTAPATALRHSQSTTHTSRNCKRGSSACRIAGSAMLTSGAARAGAAGRRNQSTGRSRVRAF
mmetsp:Transcript_62081/g.108678  ORF Transcript_62081/g.108678 Transcript_62081/m.108678 type:complete len:227 (+) Transcript_62081:103-783(+)